MTHKPAPRILPHMEPCPFCKGTRTALFTAEGQGVKEWWVFCRTCNATGPVNDLEEEAIHLWNRQV